MKTIGKSDDRTTPGNLACQFQCSLNGIGPGWPGELYFVFEIARLENDRFKIFQELPFCRGIHIQAVGYTIVVDIFDHGVFHGLVVVTEVQHTGPGKKIYVPAPGFIKLFGIAGLVEYYGK